MIKNDKPKGGVDNKKFYCEICDYFTDDKYNLRRHLSTQKHEKIKMIKNEAKNEPKEAHGEFEKNAKAYICKCGKNYNHQSNMIRHKKTNCKFIENKIVEKSENETNYKEIIMTLINENKELMKTITELVPKIGNTTNNTIHNNNITNNANFNMNIFLNEQCKDALNIDDFIKNIEVSISHLLLTKDKGLIEGISNIFIENMNKLSLYERPVHCTDLKRETIYIKKDEWIKDKDNIIVKDAIKRVSHIQTKNVTKWSDQNPEFMKKPDKQDEFIRLVKNVSDDIDDKQNKIIKNICKNVYINDKIVKEADGITN